MFLGGLLRMYADAPLVKIASPDRLQIRRQILRSGIRRTTNFLPFEDVSWWSPIHGRPCHPRKADLAKSSGTLRLGRCGFASVEPPSSYRIKNFSGGLALDDHRKGCL